MIKKVFFDITQKCNGRCPHCYNDSGKEGFGELSDSQVKEVVDQIAERSIALSVSGGEPFLRDVPKLFSSASGRTKVSITTNGSVLDENDFEFLIHNPVHLTVSLDTLDSERAKIVRAGVPLGKVLSNLRKLASFDEIRQRLSIRTTVTIQERSEISDLIELCASCGIEQMKINSCNPFGRGKDSSYIPDFDRFRELMRFAIDYCASRGYDLGITLPVEKYLSKGARQCTLGRTSINIDPQGRVFPCAFSEGKLVLGDVTEEPLDVLFERAERFNHENKTCNQCLINRYKVK